MTTSVEDRISLEDRVSRLEGAYEHLATKADISDLKAELKTDISDSRAELKADVSELKTDVSDLRTENTHMATKADLAELRADMERLHSSTIKWMVGLVLGGMVGITGLVITVIRLLG